MHWNQRASSSSTRMAADRACGFANPRCSGGKTSDRNSDAHRTGTRRLIPNTDSDWPSDLASTTGANILCARGDQLPRAPKTRSSRVQSLVAQRRVPAMADLGPSSGQQPYSLIPVGFTVGSKPFGRTPGELAFEEFLIRTISGSLDRRTSSRNELLSIGTAEHGLSKRRANAIREHVVAQLGARAWSEAGAPRGRRS